MTLLLWSKETSPMYTAVNRWSTGVSRTCLACKISNRMRLMALWSDV
jgi:hypothetical protein